MAVIYTKSRKLVFILQYTVIAIAIAAAFFAGFALKSEAIQKNTGMSGSELVSNNENNTQSMYYYDDNNFTTDSNFSQESSDIETVVSPDHLYTVTIIEDTIVVFSRDSETPYMKIYIDIKNMPQGDIDVLKKGIYADSKAELIKILEDYN